jgi:hypothetical protein
MTDRHRHSSPNVPQIFSHLQWYLRHAQNTVHFAAQSTQAFSEEDFHALARLIMNLAPQLFFRSDVAKGRHETTDIDPREICHYETTDNLEQALARTIAKNELVFSDHTLPDFRAFCFSLRSPTENEPQSLLLCCTSHALMEGSETSRLMRSRKSVHNADQSAVKLGVLQRGALAGAGLTLAPFHLAASTFNKTKPSDGRAIAFDLDRESVKAVAQRLGVRQRSVLFSLPLFGLPPTGGRSRKRAHLVSYSSLPDIKTSLEDSALNLRMQVGRFPTAGSFEDHVRQTEKVLAREDTKEVYSQALYNSILSVHRNVQKMLPFLYGQRFFTYVPYDFVFSLLPPHISGGMLRGKFDGSVFCGSYTPGVNSCVFVPHRQGVSLNMFAKPPVLDHLDTFTEFFDRQGIRWRRVY